MGGVNVVVKSSVRLSLYQCNVGQETLDWKQISVSRGDVILVIHRSSFQDKQEESTFRTTQMFLAKKFPDSPCFILFPKKNLGVSPDVCVLPTASEAYDFQGRISGARCFEGSQSIDELVSELEQSSLFDLSYYLPFASQVLLYGEYIVWYEHFYFLAIHCIVMGQCKRQQDLLH